MTRKRFFRVLPMAALWMAGAWALAAPGLINYQGRLTDRTGRPVTAPVSVTFSFWDAEQGGQPLGDGFSDIDTVAPNSEGLYATLIGDDPDNLVPEAVFASDGVWLNVNVSGEDLSPRKRITSVGYAVRAAGADSALKNLTGPFPVAEGESVAVGDVLVLLGDGTVKRGSGSSLSSRSTFAPETGPSSHVAAAPLSDSKFVIVYQQETAEGETKHAVVAEVSGYSVVFGPPAVLGQGFGRPAVAALSESRFVVAYEAYQGGFAGVAVSGTVSGREIAVSGGAVVFNGAITSDISVAALPGDRFVVAYQDSGRSSFGTAIVGSASGATPDFSGSAEAVFNSAHTDNVTIAALTGDKVIVVYRDSGDSPYASSTSTGTAVVGQVAAMSVDFGESTPAAFSGEVVGDATGSYRTLSAAALGPDRFLVAYNAFQSPHGRARMGTVSGLGIDFPGSAEAVFNNTELVSVAATALGPDAFVLAYFRDAPGAEPDGAAAVGRIEGSDPAFSLPNGVRFSEALEDGAADAAASAAALSEGRFALIYPDGISSVGSVVIGGDPGLEEGGALGIAAAAAAAGQTLPVVLHGLSDGYAGLAIGTTYYANPDGALTAQASRVRVGVAVSPDRLLLELDR